MKKIIFLFLILHLTLNIKHCICQWVVLNSGTGQNLNSVHFINNLTGYIAGASGTILKTTNAGSNWLTINSGLTTELKSIYFFNSTTGIICGYNGTILRTTNGGSNWNTISSGTTDHLFGLSFYNDSIGICGGNSGTQLYSANGGVTWNIGSPTGYLVTFYSAFMVSATTGYCFGVNTIFSPLVAKTTNGGSNFTYYSFMVNNNEATLRDAHFFDTQNGIAVSNLWNNTGGISKTTNGGINWTSQILTYGIFGIDFPGTMIGYCVGLNGYILKSTDGGYNWNQQLTVTTAVLSSVDFIDSVNGYAVGNGGVILKTTNGGVTAIPKNTNAVPDKFELYQNYPNPFNPMTMIKFSIPERFPTKSFGNDNVVLKVYNILGKEVATLINEKLQPGTYEIPFSISQFSNYQLPSGIYFYTLSTTDKFKETKKMLMIK